MTHGQFLQRAIFLMAAAVAVLLYVLWRLMGHRIEALVNRLVPAGSVLARQTLWVILAVIFSLAISIFTLLLVVLLLHALGYA
ncbi:MAG: hypothetical protein ACLQME_23980 [Alphaproteobacteria bacterium]